MKKEDKQFILKLYLRFPKSTDQFETTPKIEMEIKTNDFNKVKAAIALFAKNIESENDHTQEVYDK